MFHEMPTPVFVAIRRSNDYLALSDDRTEASVQRGPQKMSADELSEFIRHLTQLGADMSTIRRQRSRQLGLPTLNLRRPRLKAGLRHLWSTPGTSSVEGARSMQAQVLLTQPTCRRVRSVA
jgi:hypothetical protein